MLIIGPIDKKLIVGSSNSVSEENQSNDQF